jgi:hypothetical protein
LSYTKEFCPTIEKKKPLRIAILGGFFVSMLLKKLKFSSDGLRFFSGSFDHEHSGKIWTW